MILGEGAAVFAIDRNQSSESLAKIIGLGYSTEILTHPASISADAQCFQHSMRMAIDGHVRPDLIITHCPGTVLGDKAEMEAIKEVFGENTTAVTNNKWKIGHTLGASGAMSLEMAICILQQNRLIKIPYLNSPNIDNINSILVNAVGFGGNAVSILIERC